MVTYPYTAGPERRRIIKNHFDELPEQRCIEPVQSEWASPRCAGTEIGRYSLFLCGVNTARRPREDDICLPRRDVSVETHALRPHDAPATFQGLLHILLSGYRWRTCLVYLDDVIMFSRTFEDPREILGVLKNDGLSLKIKKCHFFKESFDYLGHIIGTGKLQGALNNTEAVA